MNELTNGNKLSLGQVLVSDRNGFLQQQQVYMFISNRLFIEPQLSNHGSKTEPEKEQSIDLSVFIFLQIYKCIY